MGIFSWIRSRVRPLYRSHTPCGAGRPRSLMAGPGRVSPRMAEIKHAAAKDVARMGEEAGKFFGRNAPGNSDTD